jgi:CRP-like cAMP-binding protein
MKTIFQTDKDFICDITAPCFQNLLPDEADMIRSTKTQVLFRKGDTITKQGAFASYVLFIIKGYAKQYLEGNDGKSYNLSILLPGEFIGLSAVFNENIFSYSSTAITDCQVCLVEKETIAKLIRSNGSFGFNIIKRYCQQNSGLLTTISGLVYKQMNGRLADVLLYIDSLKTEDISVFQLLSRKDLAEFAGISMESAVKLLKNFEKDGLIELHEKDIKIMNYDLLIEISKKG